MNNCNSVLKPYHAGEELVSSLLKTLITKDRLEKVYVYQFRAKKERTTLKNLLKDFGFKSQTEDSVEPNVSIKEPTSPKYHIDSETKADVVIYRDKDFGFPIEVKLGVTGQMESWNKFKTHNLFDVTLGGDKETLVGRVPAFLARKGNAATKEILDKVTLGGKSFNCWGLCLREEVRERFMSDDSAEEKSITPHIFTFESLIEGLSDDVSERQKIFGEIFSKIFSPDLKSLEGKEWKSIQTSLGYTAK